MSQVNGRIIQIEATVADEPTPEDVAELFWNLYDDEMVKFFEHLDRIASERFIFQLSATAEHTYFSTAARRAMRTIGEYGEEQ